MTKKRKCPVCGEELEEGDLICPTCGCYIDEPAYDIEADLQDEEEEGDEIE